MTDAEIAEIQKKMRSEKAQAAPKGEMSSAWDEIRGVGSTLAKAAVGLSTGVGEAVNPLAIPHGIETLGRAVLTESGGPLERLQSASENAVMNPMRIETLAPIARSIVRKGVGEAKELVGGEESKSLADLYEDEKRSQQEFNKDTNALYARDIGEIGAGLAGLIPLVKSGGKAISSGAQKLKGLSGVISKADDAVSDLGAVTRTGPQKTLREMTGPLPQRIESAIVNRTSNVRKLLEDPNLENKGFESVIKLRENIDDTENLLTGALKEFRQTLASNKDTKFDTKPIKDMFRGFRQSQRFSNGKSALDPSDAALIDKYENLIKSKDVSVGDVVKIMDKIDDHIAPIYKRGEVTPAVRHLSEVRKVLDSALADSYPAYKESKVLFKSFQDSSEGIRAKIDSTGAESFLNNLFGQNKTEVQGLVESTLNQAEEAAKSLSSLTSEVATGSKAADAAALATIDKIKKIAGEIKSPKAQEFLDTIADQIAAKRLKSFTDKDADELTRMVNNYIRPRSNTAAGIGGAIGGFLGLKMGGPSMSVAGTMAGGWAGKGLAEIPLRNIARRKFDIINILKQIEKGPKTSGKVKQLATDAIKIGEKFGEDSVVKFLSAVQLDRASINEIAKITAAINLAAPSPKVSLGEGEVRYEPQGR